MPETRSPLPWSRPSIGEEEIAAVTDVLRSGWLTHGPRATAFENHVAADLGVQDAFAVTSATAALHLALMACGVGPGDEVITPSLTFCALPNAVVRLGARPVFIDVGPPTYTASPHHAEAAITPATKAIVIMHYGGHPCDLLAFRDLADRHDLPLIEDAAHALHAWRDGHRAGSIGDLSAFSFYANKVITTGEGGMLTGRADLVERARLLGRHGINTSAWRRHGHGNTADYQVTEAGLKYVLSDLAAALGHTQWQRLAEFTSRRAEIAATYTDALSGLPGLSAPTVLPGVSPGWFLYSIFIDPHLAPLTRDQLSEGLHAAGIATSHHFRPVHTLQHYADTTHPPLPITQHVAATQLSLPCYPAMTADDVTRVTTALHRLWTHQQP